jgi:hypothetical protein
MLFLSWLSVQPWRKYWLIASKLTVMLIAFALPSVDLGDTLMGNPPTWVSCVTVAIAFLFALLYFNKSSQAKILQSTVMRHGMIKADAIINYKVWPASGDEFDVRDSDKE